MKNRQTGLGSPVNGVKTVDLGSFGLSMLLINRILPIICRKHLLVGHLPVQAYGLLWFSTRGTFRSSCHLNLGSCLTDKVISLGGCFGLGLCIGEGYFVF